MDKRIAQNKGIYDSQFKNMRPIVIKEALEYLKQQAEVVIKMLTKTHHRILDQMLRYRERNSATL